MLNVTLSTDEGGSGVQSAKQTPYFHFLYHALRRK